jgi:hypothetical protein
MFVYPKMDTEKLEKLLARGTAAMIERKLPPFARSTRNKARNAFLRLEKSKALANVYAQLPAPDTAIHILGVNKFDAFDVIKQTIVLGGEQNLTELYINSWVCNRQVVNEIIELVKRNRLKFIFLTSTITRSRDVAAYKQLKAEVEKIGKYKVINSHAKIYLIAFKKQTFTIEASGNLTGNTAVEQYTITNSAELFRFYRDWFQEVTATG